MASLERITYIRPLHYEPPPPAWPDILYVHDDLQEIFDHYPTLQSVLFVFGYPLDHFAVDHDAHGPNVLCRVTRPEGGGPMQPVGSHVAPRDPWEGVDRGNKAK